MMYSDDRMKFIIDYISAYKQKIEMANKNGLFDSAKMFELFAEEICKLYYGIDFHNLNNDTCNFPYFDLISENEEILVQVSTVIDVHQKIKNTLENIRDDKKNRFTKINSAYFFVLHNDSIKNVNDYTGENQIGNISFTKEDNLITTQDIIQKAQNDLIFQEQLYNLLKTEFENFNEYSNKFEKAVNDSKNVGISNIDVKINDEYEIDRTELIEKIKRENAKFLSIQGTEGVGKTVICKKLIEKEDIILFARAERFIEESHIDNIWNLDIKNILELLNGKKIVFFIDALEFIADALKTKLDLLESLYNIADQYENAYIITSCRTSDKNAFLKLESKYNINDYNVNEISKDELKDLEKQYPLIKKMSQDKKYESLLKTPFYINTMIKNNVDIDSITDINRFREYIWNNIICLKKNKNKYKINVKDIEDAVNKIVFDRAQKFTLGIKETDIDSSILNVLKTEGIITYNNEGIRLKYDIYEDICFEKFFDNVYYDCKGKYQEFYKNIDKIGRCVYRRYQIWISNKLLAKENRDKFIYNLIFDNEISEEWKKQTEIGIVKSNYSKSFFEENELEIIENKLLDEFIDIVNLYSYDAKIINDTNFTQIQLNPSGKGRECIIETISKNNIYVGNFSNKSKIVKLCLDYTKQNNANDDIAKRIVVIMQYYVEITLKQGKKEFLGIMDEIEECLIVLFKLSKYNKEWLEKFIKQMIEDYKNNKKEISRIAEKIMIFTMKNAYVQLISELPKVLCDVANTLWIEERENDEESFFYRKENEYGLSNDYDHFFSNLTDNAFLWNIFRVNLKIGLDWAIQFMNKCVEKYSKNSPQNVIKIKLKFIDENTEKIYYGNPSMWMAGIKEHYIPTILSDIVYHMKETIINFIDQIKEKKTVLKLLNYIKNKIYSESNNIILLTVIENIGLHYQNEFYGFAIDLLTDINIIEWDTHRYSVYIEPTQLKMLKEQIFLKMGVPDVKNRYEIDRKCSFSITEYMQNLQINGNREIKEKCYKILDYLYSITENDKENASEYFQIQKMDFRNAKLSMIKDNLISIEPNITGEAKKMIENNKKNNLNDRVLKIIKENSDKDGKKDLSKVIDELIKIKYTEDSSAIGLEYIIIPIIANILKNEDISVNKRNEYCSYWIDGVEKILNNDTFMFDESVIPVLIEQLYSDISIENKNKIKLLVLKIVKFNNMDGVILKIKKKIIKYLQTDNKLSNIIFNTLIMLAEDEMMHQKYNANFVKQKDKKFKFVPNKNPRLYGVDRQIKEENLQPYLSKEQEIIEKYLYLENEIQIKRIKIDRYDLKMLCHIANCGKNFEDEFFSKFISGIFKCILDIKNDKLNRHKTEIINFSEEQEVINLFQRELIYSDQSGEKVIDILFDHIDFSEFEMDAIELYHRIFSDFIAVYYDSYDKREKRILIKKKIKYTEEKIEKIKEETVKKELYKCIYFSDYKYMAWDPSKIKTRYEYSDKCFLNGQFCKYGKYHFNDLMKTIYLLNIDELLPEVLISVNEVLLYNCENDSTFENKLKSNSRLILDMIITKAFINFSDSIKQDDDLINAYEGILNSLIGLNYEKAGVILDEFRIH